MAATIHYLSQFLESISMKESLSHSQRLLQLQAQVLKKIATDEDLQACLNLICSLVQESVADSICSIMLFDRERKALFVEAAPNIPKSLREMLNGLVPSSESGSCGTSVYLDEPVFVADTRIDPRWRPLLEIANALGIRACWSIPVRGSDGLVYGSFAISHTQTKTPDESHEQLLATAAHLAGIAIDRDRKTKELEVAKLRAEQANQVKSEFLANMSHEIRTPLTAILGFAEVLNDSNDDTIPWREFVNTIVTNTEHIMTIVNDILDVSRLEANQLSIEISKVDLLQTVTNVMSSLSSLATKKQLTLALVNDTPIPKHIHTDPIRLRQILLNIVGNAIKFTEQGSVQVHVACDREQNSIAFKVIDTGIGMKKEVMQRISQFNAFSQADSSTSRRFGGAGLGLKISNSLAQLLGGELKIESSSENGTTVTLTVASGDLQDSVWIDSLDSGDLPAAEQDYCESCEVHHVEQPLLGMQILIAEDGEDNQRLLRHLLEHAGATTTICDNGKIALNLLESCSADAMPHLILMDMQMPEVDGYTATRRLRNNGVSIPIIALTAHASETDREQCLAAGCDDYMAKPFQKSVLLDMCAQFAIRT